MTEFNPKAAHSVDIIVCIEGMSAQKIVHTMPSPQWIKSCIPILFDTPDIISEYQCCKKIFLKNSMYVVLNKCIYLFKNPTVFFLWYTQTHYFKIHINT